jgi:uncharacterized membrane protein YraQ (UPF0718 family)
MSWFQFSLGDFSLSFLSVILEGVPFLLLGSLLSGIVDVWVSPATVARIVPKNRILSVLIGGLLGLVFPMCECGSVIVIRRFLKKGLPLGTAVSYMLAAPIVSPIVAFSTWAAFRGQHAGMMTASRLLLGFIIAAATGLLLQKLRPDSILQPSLLPNATASRRSALTIASEPVSDSDATDQTPTLETATAAQRFLEALRTAASDFLDVTFFFVIGTLVTSLLGTAVNRSVIDPLASNPPLAIFGMQALASLLALCSTTDAFIAASGFIAFPPAAKLAFLVFGPMFDFKLFWLYNLLFKRRLILALALGLFLATGLICWRLGPVLFPN